MSDLPSVLLNLNKALISTSEVALPGSWSPKLFYNDLIEHPVKSEEILIEKFKIVMTSVRAGAEEVGYLEFFEATRGYKREIDEKIFKAFSRGVLMLHFEEAFLELLKSPPPEEKMALLNQFLNALVDKPLSKWNEITSNAGACCYQWFCKEPMLYINLLSRKDKSCFENYTDPELFEALGSSLLIFPEEGKLSVENQRSNLVEMCKKK